MDDWKPDAEAVAGGRLLYHWVVPAQVEGRWRDRSESEGVELSMTQKFQEVAGTVTAFGREHDPLELTRRPRHLGSVRTHPLNVRKSTLPADEVLHGEIVTG